MDVGCFQPLTVVKGAMISDLGDLSDWRLFGQKNSKQPFFEFCSFCTTVAFTLVWNMIDDDANKSIPFFFFVLFHVWMWLRLAWMIIRGVKSIRIAERFSHRLKIKKAIRKAIQKTFHIYSWCFSISYIFEYVTCNSNLSFWIQFCTGINK